MLRCAVLALALLGGCGRSRGVPDEDLGNLVVAAPERDQPVDLARASRDPVELGRGLARRYQSTVEALGPHAITISTKTVVTSGTAAISELSDKSVLELGAGGAWHGLYENSEDLGRETIFIKDTLYLRPRYQRWHQRAPETADEPTKARDAYVDGVFATWDLVAPAVELTEKGAATVAGRTGRAIEVKLSPSPAPMPTERLTQRKWRETRSVEAVSGVIVLDADTGSLLSAKLDAKLAFMRDGKRLQMQVGLDASVTSIGPVAVAAPPPEETIATPERRHEVEERDKLLEGLAPPTRERPSGSAAP